MGDFERVTTGLTLEEKKFLMERYGVEAKSYANGIEALEQLTPAEQQVFDKRSFISPHFTVQQVYKVKGSISPVRFNLAVFNRFAKTRALRSNYLVFPNRTLRVVFKERREKPEIIYRRLGNVSGEEVDSALRNAMEAEMRRSFDVERDPLARFLVLRTAPDEYALFVTAVNLIMPSLDVQDLLSEAQDLLPSGGGKPGQDGSESRMSGKIAVSVLKYWRSVLADLPPQPLLPNFKRVEAGVFRQEAYRAVLPSEDFERLKDKLAGDPHRMVSLLQLAWGMLLQNFSNRDDTYFCLLSSGSGKASESSGQLSMIPVRLKSPTEESIANLLQRLDKQLSLSQPFSCFQRGGLEELLGQRHDLFNHFLSFLNFNEAGASFCQAEGSPVGVLVDQQAWDAQGMPLGLYFRHGGDGISLTLLYNKYSFTEASIEALVDRYFLTLHVLLICWESQTSEFKDTLARRVTALQSKPRVPYSEEALLTCLSKLSFLRELPAEWLANLVRVAKVRTYFENDQILMGHDLGRVFFVISGSVVRYMDPGSGWFSMLDIVKEGSMLNETVLLEKVKAEVVGEVLTERAEILSLPLAYARESLLKHDAAKGKLLVHLLKEVEKYQRRWVSN